MRTDAAFIIGSRHSAVAGPCQDYARSGPNWVAVADGCSSGGLTDIGARIWVHALEQVIKQHGVGILEHTTQLLEEIKEHARVQLTTYNADDGLATLLIGGLVNETYHAVVQGDGCVAVALANGGMQYCEIVAPGNAPLYPQYTLRPSHLMQWREMINNQPVCVRQSTYDDTGVLVSLKTIELEPGNDTVWTNTWPKADVLAMLVCTDGVFTVPNKKPFDVLSELFAVHEPSGQFMQRRIAAMSRAWTKNPGAGCEDDLAVGGIWSCP